MKELIAIAGICLITIVSQAQTLRLGVYEATNVNFVSVKSDYEIRNGYSVAPSFGQGLGVIVAKELSDNIEFYTALGYRILRNNYGESMLRDNNNNIIGSYKDRVTMHNLNVSLLVHYNIKDFFLGTGVGSDYLITARSKGFNYSFQGNSYLKNHQLKKVLLNVPVQVGLKYHGLIFGLSYEVGISNRLKQKSFIRAYNNTIGIFVAYVFKGKKED